MAEGGICPNCQRLIWPGHTCTRVKDQSRSKQKRQKSNARTRRRERRLEPPVDPLDHAIVAKYRGKCWLCSKRIEPGMRIRLIERGSSDWVHEECWPVLSP